MLPVPPHFFGLAQRNGVEPQRKTLLGWWRPREVSGPTRLSHSRGSCHSAAKVSASRTDWITRAQGKGLGAGCRLAFKSFLPRFFTKKRAGSRGGALAARRSARNTPMLKEAQEGVKGGNPRRGFPLCGRPPPPAAPARCRGAGGGRRKGSSRTPTPTAGGRRHVCRVIYCEIIPRPGWRNVVRLAETVAAGRRGRRPLQGWCDAVGSSIIPRPASRFAPTQRRQQTRGKGRQHAPAPPGPFRARAPMSRRLCIPSKLTRSEAA